MEMITTLNKVLADARAKKSCVVAVNVYNLETVQAVLDGARQMNSPVIVAFGETYLSHASLEVVAAMVRALDSPDLEIVLHLDHAKKLETIEEALACGFSSVMYDGSSLTLNDNITNSRMVVAMAARYGASVEGELGYLNPETGGDGLVFSDRYTRVEEAQRFVKDSGVDALAIAVGNAHGVYGEKPLLDFDRIDAIARATSIPLVLHGSSGIPAESLRKAISFGVTKINVNTEVAMAGAAAAKHLVAGGGEQVRFEKLAAGAREEMTRVVCEYMSMVKREGAKDCVV